MYTRHFLYIKLFSQAIFYSEIQSKMKNLLESIEILPLESYIIVRESNAHNFAFCEGYIEGISPI